MSTPTKWAVSSSRTLSFKEPRYTRLPGGMTSTARLKRGTDAEDSGYTHNTQSSLSLTRFSSAAEDFCGKQLSEAALQHAPATQEASHFGHLLTRIPPTPPQSTRNCRQLVKLLRFNCSSCYFHRSVNLSISAACLLREVRFQPATLQGSPRVQVKSQQRGNFTV